MSQSHIDITQTPSRGDILGYQWSKSRVSREARIKALFKTIDTSRRGFIDDEDLIAFYERNMGERSDADSAQMYANELISAMQGKQDGNGQIFFDDFRRFVLAKEQSLRELFREIDRSGDGFIDPMELRRALEINGIRVTDEGLNRFMKTIDSDSDQHLSFDELVDFALLIPKVPDLESLFWHYKTVYDTNFDMDVMPVEKNKKKASGEGWRYFLSGAVAGAVSRTLTAPLDRLRVYFQTIPDHHKPGEPKTLGTSEYLRAIRDIRQNGGILSFWRGNGINILKIAPESAIMFASYEKIKSFIAQIEGQPSSARLSPFGRFLAGGVAGMISQTFAYPLDTIKTRMMSNIAAEPLASSTQLPPTTFMSTFKSMMSEGPKTFFRGWVPATMGSLPYSGISLMAFDGLKQRWKAKNGPHREPDPISVLLMGGLSGCVAATSVYPLHAIRTRLQAQGTLSHPHTYKGFLDCALKSVQRDGIMGLWRGLSASLAKVLPASGSSYLVYEACKRLLHVD